MQKSEQRITLHKATLISTSTHGTLKCSLQKTNLRSSNSAIWVGGCSTHWPPSWTRQGHAESAPSHLTLTLRLATSPSAPRVHCHQSSTQAASHHCISTEGLNICTDFPSYSSCWTTELPGCICSCLVKVLYLVPLCTCFVL